MPAERNACTGSGSGGAGRREWDGAGRPAPRSWMPLENAQEWRRNARVSLVRPQL